MTKDRDFLTLLDRLGPSPQIVWVTIGNTSNAFLRNILGSRLRAVLDLVQSGEALVELGELSSE